MTLSRSRSLLALVAIAAATIAYALLSGDHSAPQAILGKAGVVAGILGKA